MSVSFNEIGSNNTKALFSPSGLILCGCICLLCLCCLNWVSILCCIHDNDNNNLAIYHISYSSLWLIYVSLRVLWSLPKWSLINFSLSLHRASFFYAIKNSQLPLCHVDWDECACTCTCAVKTRASSRHYFEVYVFNSGVLCELEWGSRWLFFFVCCCCFQKLGGCISGHLKSL